MKFAKLLKGAGIGVFFVASLLGFDGGPKSAPSNTSSAVEITWRVNANEGGVGSGVYIGNGLIVTARHVVRDAAGHAMTVTDQAGERVVATPYWSSKTTDVAVVKLSDKLNLIQSSSLDKRIPIKGEPLEVVGCPMGRPFVHTFGVVTSSPENPFPSWQDAIEISAVIQPGNSGGPVYDRDGKVLGIAVGAILDNNKQPIAYIMISAREVALTK